MYSTYEFEETVSRLAITICSPPTGEREHHISDENSHKKGSYREADLPNSSYQNALARRQDYQNSDSGCLVISQTSSWKHV